MGFRTHLIVLSMAAILWCATATDAADDGIMMMSLDEIKTLLATEKLQKDGEPVNPTNLEKAKRVIEETAKRNERQFCRYNPCAWATYDRFSRRIDFTLKNSCSCPENWKCIRTGDDVMGRSYVYRCSKEWTDEDIVFKELDEEDEDY